MRREICTVNNGSTEMIIFSEVGGNIKYNEQIWEPGRKRRSYPGGMVQKWHFGVKEQHVKRHKPMPSAELGAGNSKHAGVYRE